MHKVIQTFVFVTIFSLPLMAMEHDQANISNFSSRESCLEKLKNIIEDLESIKNSIKESRPSITDNDLYPLILHQGIAHSFLYTLQDSNNISGELDDSTNQFIIGYAQIRKSFLQTTPLEDFIPLIQQLNFKN